MAAPQNVDFSKYNKGGIADLIPQLQTGLNTPVTGGIADLAPMLQSKLDAAVPARSFFDNRRFGGEDRTDEIMASVNGPGDAPTPPTPTDPAVATQLTAAEQSQNSARSRAATIFNTGRGLLKGPMSARRSLLGS